MSASSTSTTKSVELADLYEDATGLRIKRAYAPSEYAEDGQGAETGYFLDLARNFGRMVNDTLPPHLRRPGPPSLSKLVREESERREKPMAR